MNMRLNTQQITGFNRLFIQNFSDSLISNHLAHEITPNSGCKYYGEKYEPTKTF